MNATEYTARAQQYRPRDESALARECYRLFATGLTARDIATALRLELGVVLAMLKPTRNSFGFEEAAEAHARTWTR